MKLKVRLLKLKAGKPVAFIHEDLAKKIGVHTGDRVSLSKNGPNIIAVVDLARGFIKKGEQLLCTDLIKISIRCRT